MAKHKAGLHKEISSIFDGTPIPKDRLGQQPFSEPKPEPKAPNYTKPATTSEQTSQSQPPQPAIEPARVPESKPPQQLPPQVAVPKKSQADIITKTSSQNQWQQSWKQIKQKLFAPKTGVNTKRQVTTAVLIPVLFIVLILVLKQVLSTGAPKTTLSQTLTPQDATAAIADEIDWQIPPPYPETLRDPMQPASAATNPLQEGNNQLIVKGILYTEDNPSAVIGTKIVKTGEEVAGAKVVKINKDNVEFEMNGKTWKQKVQ